MFPVFNDQYEWNYFIIDFIYSRIHGYFTRDFHYLICLQRFGFVEPFAKQIYLRQITFPTHVELIRGR